MSKDKSEAPKKGAGKTEHNKPEKPKKTASHASAHPTHASAKQAPRKTAPKGGQKTRAAAPKSAAHQAEGAPAKTEPGKVRPQKKGAERRPAGRTTGYRANVPFLRVSPTKIRRIADHIRRKPYVEAIALLDVLPHKGARLLRKVIQSAAANALSQNKGLDEQMLFVKELLVDGGPTMKRMWARGRGRADRLLKRSCHISAVVDEIGGKEVDNGSKG